MYRIELAPGEETVFRTLEELAVAVRNGLVTPRCRIYHNATQKWLPIEFHPHYKKALSLPAARVAEAAAPRTSGHPPALETLSFAVAPAARPSPAAEPVAEPAPELTAEARAGQSGTGSAERSDATQSGTGSSATDAHADPARPGAESPATAHASKEQSATPHSPKEHSAAEHSGARHSVTDHSAPDRTVADRSGTDRSGTELPVAEHPETEHPETEHPATTPRLREHPATKRLVTNHPATDLPRSAARAHAVTIYSADRHPVADETTAQAAIENPAIENPAVEHPDTAAESPIRAEPEPAPKSTSSSYRPDTYLPASVRVVADDPHVAIAPEPPPAPPVPASPRRSWSMMPAVQETPELPTISYPEFTPAVEPVAERVSSSRGHRPLQVAVAVLVLAAGGYLAKSFYSPVRGSQAGGDGSAPAAAVADRPALPKDASAPVPAAVTTKPSPNRPAIVTPTAPASSGFAAALEPRAIASGPAPVLPAHEATSQLPPAVSAADSTAVAASIAPPPAEMPIDVPALPGGDSLVAQPRSKSDSAMKRILRAVNGGQTPK